MAVPINKASGPFYTKLAMILVCLISIGYLFVLGKQLLSPLLYSFLFAILLTPIAQTLEKRFKIPRGGAAALSVILMLLAIAIIVYFVGEQLTKLAHEWPTFKDVFMASISKFQHWFSRRFHVNVAEQINYINGATSNMMTSSTTIIGKTIFSLSSILLFLVFILIDTFFILYYRRLLIKFLLSACKEENALTVNDIVEQVQYIIRKYIVGLLTEMGIVSGICCIAFSIIGIQYAILLGFITGLFNIIPYIGIFTSLVLTTLITIGTAASTTTIILVMVTIVAMHLVDSNFLLPFIVGSKVKINGFITLIGVVVGEMLWGISGMFLSIPVIAISKIVFDRIESFKPWGYLLGEAEDELIVKKRRWTRRKIKDKSSLEQKTL